MSIADSPDVQLARARKPALLVGVAAAILFLLLAFRDPVQFFRSYLFAYMFWISFPLGALGLLMLHHMTGGGWGFVIRRLCEAATRTFALMLVLFLPLLGGLTLLYPWMQPGFGARVAPFKAVYLTLPFFLGRQALYFFIWIILGYFLSKWSFEEDSTGDLNLHRKMEALSAPGLILYGFTATFSSIDWVMSLEPQWTSTIYGMVIIAVQVFTALAFLIAVASRFADHQPLAPIATSSRFHDLGTLLFTWTMLWAFPAFSQYLIIWAGNIKSEISWYVRRGMGGWAGVALFLLLFHFCFPFLILLSRTAKRHRHVLAAVSGAMVVVSAVDVFWLVTPAFFPSPTVHLSDFLALAAIGGIWLWAFAGRALGRPLVPLRDVRMEVAVEHGA